MSEESSSESLVEQFEVEAVVDHRWINGKIQYRLHWKGYPDSEDTWEEDNENLQRHDLISNYIARKGPKSNFFDIFTKQNEIPKGLRIEIKDAYKKDGEIKYKTVDSKGTTRILSSTEAVRQFPLEVFEYLQNVYLDKYLD
ncbi:hypothetical protein TVAG_107050 [Trichomonas vaginalis G3]|uniref:Chromo domain-containing protein n=1 Tax=Trichomonas vaginalis (strain ATCC PRA-98 / G3) TaxID=412133 RepID=A2FE46_TRIV3|nr:positive regulation of extent of heterochromatin assembly [Trichomonas vaginalis G3]EAX96818.1 hypothetical protein TVAG_107050 [Trichomonas vaginalis G3]KAI5536685.1 positive regulation of extent of heterochromatin assembly [Trichomonas vaginalis G3]|eukprot:XP_001309748.1 hypothetical protein [Trichomonas vaginalis G3]